MPNGAYLLHDSLICQNVNKCREQQSNNCRLFCLFALSCSRPVPSEEQVKWAINRRNGSVGQVHAVVRGWMDGPSSVWFGSIIGTLSHKAYMLWITERRSIDILGIFCDLYGCGSRLSMHRVCIYNYRRSGCENNVCFGENVTSCAFCLISQTE